MAMVRKAWTTRPVPQLESESRGSARGRGFFVRRRELLAGQRVIASRERMVRSIRGISCCLMAVGFGVGLLVHAQPVSRRRFDAALVKRCASNVVAGTSAGVVTVTRVDFTCQTLEFYVRSVYRQSMGKFTGTLRIEGGPPWIR